MRAPLIRFPAFSFVVSLAAACGREEGSDLGAGVDSGIDATLVDTGHDVAIDSTKQDATKDVVDTGHDVGLDATPDVSPPEDSESDLGVDATPDSEADGGGVGRCFEYYGWPDAAGAPPCEAGMVCELSEGGSLFGHAECVEADVAPGCGVIGCVFPCDCIDVPLSECACALYTSTARAKRDIAYIDLEAEERLRNDLLSVRLATYRYRPGVTGESGVHLGFIIEDMPAGSPAVASPTHVDLYGFVSMAVATIQAQQRELDALRGRIARLEAIG
jgi:hypothetical protein